MMREEDRDRVCRQGTEAWRRLKREKSWGDWLKVGEALQIGREWAMNQAGTNQPLGKGYNMAFGEWLQKYKLDDMDKGTRSRLDDVMDNLSMIEDWRQKLTLTERLKLNHPNAVMRKWKAAMEPEKPKSDKPTLKDSVVNLSEEVAAKDGEIASLKAHIAELEAAREVTSLDLDAARKAYADVVTTLTKEECKDEVFKLLGKLGLTAAFGELVEVPGRGGRIKRLASKSKPQGASPEAA